MGDTEFKPDLFGSFACYLRYLSVRGTDFFNASLIFYCETGYGGCTEDLEV